MKESTNVQSDEKNFANMQNSDKRTYNEVKKRSSRAKKIF